MKLFLLGVLVGIFVCLWLIARSIVTTHPVSRRWMDDDAYEIPFDPRIEEARSDLIRWQNIHIR